MKQRESGLPFDDIRAIVAALPQPNAEIAAHTLEQARNAPGIGEGRLLELCKWYSAHSGRSPVITNPVLAVFAGTHKAWDGEEPWLFERVAAIASGNSGINRLCEASNISLKLMDLALQVPVENIVDQPAFDEKACAGTIAFGMEVIAGGVDLLCLAAVEKAPGPSVLALLAKLLGIEIGSIADGFGFSCLDETMALSRKAASRAQAANGDPLELLRHLGGRETAAICGAIVSARSQHVPVVLAGPSAIASAILLARMKKGAVDHCLLANVPVNDEFSELLSENGLNSVCRDAGSVEPAIDAAMAATVIRAASLVLAEGQGVNE